MDFTLLAIAVLLTLTWLLIVRPQRRRQAQTIAMQNRLRTGDEIVTAGGLYGTVEAVEGDDVHVEIAPGTTVRVARRAIVDVVANEDEESEPEMPNSEAGS